MESLSKYDVSKMLEVLRKDTDKKFDTVRDSIVDLKVSYVKSTAVATTKMHVIVFFGTVVGSALIGYIFKHF